MRKYSSVNWACTEETIKFKGRKMTSGKYGGKAWNIKPKNRMFLKLFR